MLSATRTKATCAMDSWHGTTRDSVQVDVTHQVAHWVSSRRVDRMIPGRMLLGVVALRRVVMREWITMAEEAIAWWDWQGDRLR